MAKRTTKRRKRLKPLTSAGRNIVSHVINSIALGEYIRLQSVEHLAASLHRTPAGLQRMLARLIEGGYLQRQGDAILPTVEAIRYQDPELSEQEAAKVLKAAKKSV